MKLYVGKNSRTDWVSLSPTDIDIIKSFGNGEVEEIFIDNVLHTVSIQQMVQLVEMCVVKLKKGGKIDIVINDWYEICSRFVHSLLQSDNLSKLIEDARCGFSHSEMVGLLSKFNIEISQIRHEIDGYQTYISGTKK